MFATLDTTLAAGPKTPAFSMKTCLSVLAAAAATSALPASYIQANEATLWASFKATYNKQYSGSDESVRRAIFTRNMMRASALEKQNPEAQFGMNAFADLTEAEFKATHHNLDAKSRVHTPSPPRTFVSDAEALSAATPVDWRKKVCAVAATRNSQLALRIHTST